MDHNRENSNDRKRRPRMQSRIVHTIIDMVLIKGIVAYDEIGKINSIRVKQTIT
jgi:hypothetical protein